MVQNEGNVVALSQLFHSAVREKDGVIIETGVQKGEIRITKKDYPEQGETIQVEITTNPEYAERLWMLQGDLVYGYEQVSKAREIFEYYMSLRASRYRRRTDVVDYTYEVRRSRNWLSYCLKNLHLHSRYVSHLLEEITEKGGIIRRERRSR